MLNPESKISPTIIAVLCITAITILTFLPVLHFDFVMWDDDISIYRNPLIQGIDWAHLKQMFQADPNLLKYAPLYWVSLGVTYAIFGLDPFGYHLGNLLLHTASSILLFYILLRLFLISFDIAKIKAVQAAFWSSLFWAVHPLRVNVVALSANRSYCQATFAILISFLCYLIAISNKETGKPTRLKWSYWFSIFAFAASLLSFPIGLCFVGALVALDAFYFRRFNLELKDVIVEKVPFIIVTAGVLGLNFFVRSDPEGLWTGYQYASVNFHQIMKAFYMWAFYFWKPWLPLNLTPVNPIFFHSSPADLRFLFSAAAVISLSVLLFVFRKKRPGLLILWLVHLCLLLPVLGLTESIHYPSERYAYLQGMLWSIAIGWGLCLLYDKADDQKYRGISSVFALGVIAVLISLTIPYTSIWKNSDTLFAHILGRFHDDIYRADIYWRLGKASFEKREIEKSLGYLNRSLKINPNHANALFYRGMCYTIKEAYEPAVMDLRKALQVYPKNAFLRFYLADALSGQGKRDEAKAYFEAIRSEGYHPDMLYVKMAQAYEQDREPRKAIRAYNQALWLNPKNEKVFQLRKMLLNRLP